jgi:hypothetical protein
VRRHSEAQITNHDKPSPKKQGGSTLSRAASSMRPYFVFYTFELDFVTAPLFADLFLLCVQAIGRTEVHDGTVGTDSIFPIDVRYRQLQVLCGTSSGGVDASAMVPLTVQKPLEWCLSVSGTVLISVHLRGRAIYDLTPFVHNRES